MMILAILLFGAASLEAAPRATSAPCSRPEYHQFDFFAGDWDTYDVADAHKIVARNRVDAILGGCVLRELYESADGEVGQSFSIYDASRNVWHQSWVTNRGQLLVIEGGIKGKRMILTGTDPAAAGGPALVRGIWYRVDGGVRETADTSQDGGKTWKPWFDIVFRAHGR